MRAPPFVTDAPLEAAASSCPTLDQLRGDKLLDRGFSLKDLRCEDDEIVCTTAGPDRREGTKDDVVMPPPETK
jgi:hypothetical protein